jgi:hypothetical protein
VVHALGIDIPPVTGHFRQLAQAIAPQVVELYGSALTMMGQSGGNLARIVGELVTGFDDWMARLDLYMAKQSHTDGLVQSGADVLQQMGVVLAHLGVALENLMKSDPGTVHFLLDVVEMGSKVVEVFTEIPTPILYTALAIHSFMLWGGLLTSWAVKAASPFVTLGKNVYGAGAALGVFGDGAKAAAAEARAAAEAAGETAESGSKTGTIFTWLNKAGIWGWTGVGVAALGALIYWMTTADSATKGFISNLNSGLGSLSAGQAILQIGTDVGQLDHQITQVVPHVQDLNEQANRMSTQFGKSVEAAIGGVPEMLSSWSAFGREFGNIGDSVVKGVKLIGSEVGLVHGFFAESSDISAYKAAIVSLTKEQDSLFGETAKLMGQGYSYSQSLALMDLAGVKAGDSLAVMGQKVTNLITGYKDMSVQGSLLANSVDAVTFASEQQDSKVTALTQGWTAFISTVTGGESAFATFEEQVQGLGLAASGAAANLAISSGKAGVSTKAAAAAATSAYKSTAMSANSANSAVTTYTSSVITSSAAAARAATASSKTVASANAAAATAASRAQNYQQQLIQSLVNAGMTATAAAGAVSTYTTAVTRNGMNSRQAQQARGQLITDLQKAGAAAKQTTSAVSTGAQTADASIDGLNTASLQLKGTWQTAITDASSMMNALITQASAAGLGAKGTQLLTQAGKDMVAQLLPMAKGSSDATAELYALAQEAGYRGPDAFQSLVTWVGKTKGAEQDLENITNKLTVASANLATDVANLANAVNQDLNTAMAAAIVQAGGGQKAFDDFATAAMRSRDNTADMTGSADELAQVLLKTIGNTGQAGSEFDAFAQKLGFTHDQAELMWQAVAGGAQSLGDADPAVQAITSDFDKQQQSADKARTTLDSYTKTVRQYGVWSGQAEAVSYQLIAQLQGAGLSSRAAYAALTAYNDAIQKNGVNSRQAEAARAKLLDDIIAADTNGKQGAADLEKYTQAVADNGAKSQQAQSVRAQLIKDLENAGLTAKQATTLVGELTTSITKIPKSELIKILTSGNGSYSISEGVTASDVPLTSAGVAGNPDVYTKPAGKATGGQVKGGSGRPRADDVPILASADEFVVQAPAVRKYGVSLFESLNAMHLADGGLVTSGNTSVLTGQYATAMVGTFKTSMEKAMVAAMKTALQNAAASGAGPGGGSAAQNEALAKSMFPWPMSQWPAFYNVEMAEAGFNQYAKNPSSGAYGMPQALPYTKMPKAAWPASAGGSSNPRAQLTWMFDYIGAPGGGGGRYGTPDAAWAHEQAYHWYGKGGHMAPGEIGVVGDSGLELVQAGQHGATVTPMGGREVNINLNYFGTQDPTPEQQHAMIMNLTRAVGMAG